MPPPPTIGELGKYGLAKAGYSDGGFTTQIPLYTYTTKNLSLPIVLSYSTNGFKTDKLSGRTGLDWSLIAGGNIGKMTLGKPDESVSWVQYPSDFPNTRDDSLWNLIFQVTGGTVETNPDVYTLSFNGGSGRFLYVKNQIIKLEQNNLDIQKNGDNFTVTDGNGIKYLFSVIEKSASYSSCGGHPYTGQINNGWLLSQIVHPYGDTLTITYKPVSFSYSTGINQSSVFYKYSDPDYCTSTSPPTYPVFQTCVNNITNYGWLTDKIYSNSRGVIVFNYADRPDVTGDSLLSSIKVYDATADRFGNLTYYNTTPIKEITFDYSFSAALTTYKYYSGMSTDKRVFLTELDECTNTGSNNCLVYSFFYNSPDSLPKRLTFAQDHFGYFNGKTTNKSLIPEPGDLKDYNALLSYGFGNRSPDWTFAKKGCLSKIVYPTGGYDTILYEANTIYTPGSADCNYPDTSYSRFVSGDGEFKKTYYYLTDIFTIRCGQFADVSLSNIPLAGTTYDANYYTTSAYFTNGVANTTPVVQTDTYGAPLSVTKGQTKTFRVYLEAGTYRLRIGVAGPGTGNGSFTLRDSRNLTGNVSVPGIRVKKIITYPSKANPITREFLYANSFTDTKSSGWAYLPNPAYQSTFTHTIQCPSGGSATCLPKMAHYLTYTSDNFYNLYTYTGNNIYYTTVAELLDSGGRKGATAHFYNIAQDRNATVVTGGLYRGAPLSNFGIYNGFENATRYYKSDGYGNFTLLKEELKHQRADTRVDSAYSFYGFHDDAGFTAGCLQSDNHTLYQVKGLDVVNYSLLSEWLYTDTLTTKDYMDNGTTISTTTVNSYDNTVHKQVTSLQTTGSRQEIRQNKIYYSTDAFTPATTEATNAKTQLASLHMYEAPLKQESYQDGSLLETVNSNYSTALAAAMPLLQQYESVINSQKNVGYTVYQYGKYGNIEYLKLKDKTPVSYIWGYRKRYPVAMVQNAAYADVAYCSFEDDETGGWQYTGSNTADATAPTGGSCYTLGQSGNSAISKSGLTAANTYIVSYWTKNAASFAIAGTTGAATKGNQRSGWTYYEHRVSGQTSVTLSGTGAIDELRVYPANAQMTTTTYSPLIGATSYCDANNRISYYSYDGLGQLLLVRDQDGNIVKKAEYSYGGGSTGSIAACDCNNNIDKKCIGGFCQQGRRVNTSTVKNATTGKWKCTYHFVWSDNSVSADFTEDNTAPCDIN